MKCHHRSNETRACDQQHSSLASMGSTSTGRVRSAMGTHFGKVCITLKVPLSKVVNLKVLQWSCSVPLEQDFSYTRQLSHAGVCSSGESVQQKVKIKQFANTKAIYSVNDIKRSKHQRTCSLNSPRKPVSGWSDRVRQ